MSTHTCTLTHTHLRIGSIWICASGNSPDPDQSEHLIRSDPRDPLPSSFSLPLPVVSHLIVSNILSWKREITAGRGMAVTTGNSPFSGRLLVSTIRLIRVGFSSVYVFTTQDVEFKWTWSRGCWWFPDFHQSQSLVWRLLVLKSRSRCQSLRRN